ncbi:UDP-N-acetylmuramoyl-L-alanyl-D-glutamate--2,6-diaminopimelate ligase [Coriobacteriales bacterium OH1046]|nr:UDP-N-acetylmuramoyl-L-alanyl-D-glutamate--2,6-diaminopimelate ligase [Coriobacteriales bacterium OH1046]
METTLSHVIDVLDAEKLLVRTVSCTHDALAAPITGADCDSRAAAASHLFICKGRAFRAEFLETALEKGCIAYLCGADLADELAARAPGTPSLIVSDVRRAMGMVSPICWGHPDRRLNVLGITGTKGKSTVAYMLRSILDGDEAYEHAGIMGSIETFDGVEGFESRNTTPEAPDLWRHLANAADSGLDHMIMEVSSQGLKYGRVVGLGIDVGCFLNIGRDHISAIEHPDFGDYFESKLRIFDQTRTAVVNLDCDHAGIILDRARRCERVLTFSAKSDTADIWASDIIHEFGLVGFMAHTPSWEGRVTIPMPGLFNIENALAAIAICEAVGIARERIIERFFYVRVPGRMELLFTPDRRITAIVDYAHNKLSYQRFFSSMKEEFPGFWIAAVFGCPGDKALERRVELPQEAATWCDLLVYTEEDPAHEDVADICAEMAANTPEGVDYEIIPDREEAIGRAVELAYACGRPALVCLLAKGDETRQHEGDLFVPSRADGDIFNDAVRTYGPGLA